MPAEAGALLLLLLPLMLRGANVFLHNVVVVDSIIIVVVDNSTSGVLCLLPRPTTRESSIQKSQIRAKPSLSITYTCLVFCLVLCREKEKPSAVDANPHPPGLVAKIIGTPSSSRTLILLRLSTSQVQHNAYTYR